METMKPAEMLEFIKQVNTLIEDETQKRLSRKTEDPYQSGQTAELVTALAKAQGEYPSIGNNKVNPFFKSEYADFDSIMSGIRPVLSKNGLVLSQYTVIDQETGGRTLHSRLMHSSGQWIESRERIIPEKNDDQKWASSVTFKKRHQAMAILNITIDRDKYDDDAEGNMQETRVNDFKGTAPNYDYTNKSQPYDTVNALELGQLQQALQGWPDLCKLILDRYKISTLADLPRAKYAHVITQIRANIDQRKKGTTPAAE